MSRRRYTSEEQILNEIDRCRDQAMHHLRLAEGYLAEAEAIKIAGDPAKAIDIEQKISLAEAYKTKADNLFNKRLKRLGEKLSEFRTMMLPMEGCTDLSIPVRLNHKLEDYLHFKRLDAALNRRRSCNTTDTLHDARCEVCFKPIPLYSGTVEGVICSSCYDLTGAGCTRIEPLAITRSAIREK